MTGRHGSLTGLKDHYAAGEPGCPECLKAHSDWQTNYRKRRYLQRGRMTIPAVGTVRRLQALARQGWTYKDIGARMDPPVSDRAIGNIIIGAGRNGGLVHRRTAAKIAEIYRELYLTPGPSKVAAVRAAKSGFPTWLDWEDIDDPREVPYCHSLEVALAEKLENDHAEAVRMEMQRRKRERMHQRLATDTAFRQAHHRKRSELRRRARQRDRQEAA